MTEATFKKCYDCIYRGGIPGSAHSRCRHPKVLEAEDQLPDLALKEALATFASVGRYAPVINTKAAKDLEIFANVRGVEKRWFNWPYNFDPI